MKTGFTGWEKARQAYAGLYPVHPVDPVKTLHGIVAELDALKALTKRLK